MEWPPSAAAFYLDASAERPVFQGDVFPDVPFVKAMAGDRPTDDPKVAVERRHVVTVLHPCDMYANNGCVLNRVQAVAVVKKADINIPEDWGGALSICPLPDLLGDGEMWMADLTRVANVDRSYLDCGTRVRCLSELGWAIFRQRLAVAGTRAMPRLEDLISVGKVTWQEAELETTWVSAGRDSPSFQRWFDEPDPDLGGFERRKALERGMGEGVRASLIAALDK